MIDGNLAVKADEPPDPCESNRCEWPDGCSRGAGHRVAVPGWGSLYLCRRHAGEVWAGGRPATKQEARSAKEKVEVLATLRRRARDEARAALARRQAAKEQFAVLATRNRAALARRKVADSPARAPSKPRVDDEARRPVVHHRRRSSGAGIVGCLLLLAALVFVAMPLWLPLLLLFGLL